MSALPDRTEVEAQIVARAREIAETAPDYLTPAQAAAVRRVFAPAPQGDDMDVGESA